MSAALKVGEALAIALGAGETDDALSVISATLKKHGIHSLLVTVDQHHTEPYVATTIEARDITVPMVQGFVFELLDKAGVKNPAPQAAIAASFVTKYVSQNVPRKG